jgi:protein-disulfide isomerase
MKKILLLTSIILLANGCQKAANQVLEKVAQLEKRIELLEKKLQGPQAQKPEEQAKAFDIPVGKSYIWGNPNAPITITKFSDYECPFCSRGSVFLDKVMEDPTLKDKVKIVFKHFPLSFHKNARPASKVALAAGEQGHDCFWKMSKKLYQGQKELSDENYKKWAKEIKCKQGNAEKPLNVDKLLSDLKNNDAKYEAMIKEDMELGTTKAEVRGTPSFFINGWRLGRRDVEAVKEIITQKKLDSAASPDKAVPPAAPVNN